MKYVTKAILLFFWNIIFFLFRVLNILIQYTYITIANTLSIIWHFNKSKIIKYKVYMWIPFIAKSGGIAVFFPLPIGHFKNAWDCILNRNYVEDEIWVKVKLWWNGTESIKA